jgi:branched-chain amino acid aminotransferase
MWTWQDKRFFKEASVAGPGVFETMLCRHGRVAFLDQHIRRLQRGFRVLGGAVRELVSKNRRRPARLRLSVSKAAGRICVTVSARPLPRPSCWPQPRPPASYALMLEKKKKLLASKWTRIKSLRRDFYEGLYAQARARGFDEVAFLNTRNEVMEASRANIFCVKDGIVMTPRLESGCLPGITRDAVLTLLRKNKVRCRALRLSAARLMDSEEIFLTNAIIGVMPVSRLGARRLPVGPLTRRVVRVYRDLVEKACRMR